MTIGQMFPFKDKIQHVEEQSLVVYYFECVGKDAEGKYCTARPGSAVNQHLLNNRTYHMKKVKIIDSADNTKLRIKELLHSLTRNPSLNKQLGTQSNYEIKTLIIQAYPHFRQSK